MTQAVDQVLTNSFIDLFRCSVYLVFDWSSFPGPKSIISKGSTIVVNLKDDIKPHNWSAGIVGSKGHQIRVKILTPPDSIIGNCMLSVDTKLFRKEKVREKVVELAESLDHLASHESVLRIVDSNERQVNEEKEKNEAYNVAENEEQEPPPKTAIYRYFHNEPICLLFNPWLDGNWWILYFYFILLRNFEFKSQFYSGNKIEELGTIQNHEFKHLIPHRSWCWTNV